MFSRVSLRQYMTGEAEAVMRKSGEARRERRKKFCLLVCFAYLLVCFSSFLCRCYCFSFLAFFLIFRP
jgi:hypothetical protein